MYHTPHHTTPHHTTPHHTTPRHTTPHATYPQRLIVSFPKMFHLANICVVDEWDRDAQEEVAQREFGSPDALQLDPVTYSEVIASCCEMHDVAKQVCARTCLCLCQLPVCLCQHNVSCRCVFVSTSSS
jgi:hypothetical protein